MASRNAGFEVLLEKDRLHQVLKQLPVVIYAREPFGDCAVTFVSENVTSHYGYAPEEFTDDPKFWINHVHVEDRWGVLNSFRSPLSGDYYTQQYRFQHKDESYRRVRDTAALIRDPSGNAMKLVGYMEDVTQPILMDGGRRKQGLSVWKRAEYLEDEVERRASELAASEKKFREFANLLPQIAFEIDQFGSLTFVNLNALAVTGYTQEDLDKGLNILQVIAPKDQERAKRDMYRVMNGERIRGNEYTMARKDGGTFPVVLFSNPILHETKTAGMRGIIVDITEQKENQERLQRTERMAAIGETAAMVGHDLRNPLQAISGAVDILRQKWGPTADRKIIEMLTVIDRGIKYSDKIVNDLLEYSREIRLEVSESNPRSVAEAALLQVECSQNIVLKNLTRETPKILIDVTKVQRVFMNLIKNAIDAMPRGGELTITSKESNGILELKFTDTGEGIPENVMRDLWKPLRTSKPKGLGLGLVICKRIVEAHGGSIHAKSITGKGSTFTIRLPINQNVRTNPNSEMEPEFCNSPNYDAVTG